MTRDKFHGTMTAFVSIPVLAECRSSRESRVASDPFFVSSRPASRGADAGVWPSRASAAMPRVGGDARVAASARSRALAALARDAGLDLARVRATAALLDDQCTVPFIARYRKEATGGMDETVVRDLARGLAALDALEARRRKALAGLERRGVLTEALRRAIRDAPDADRLDDVLAPHASRRSTRAECAVQAGLEPLADALLDLASGADPEGPGRGGAASRPWCRAEAHGGCPRRLARAFLESPSVSSAFYASAATMTPDDALAGARDVIAERASNVPEAREAARRDAFAFGALVASAARQQGNKDAPGKKKDAASKSFPSAAARAASERAEAKARDAARQYLDFRRPLRAVKPHQILAIERAESAGVLRARVANWDGRNAVKAATRALLTRDDAPDDDPDPDRAQPQPRSRVDGVVHHRKEKKMVREVEAAVADGVERLLAPRIDREARASLREGARTRAAIEFGENVRALLAQAPLRPRAPVVGLDPGFRTGCKLAAVDARGEVLGVGVVYLPEVSRSESRAKSEKKQTAAKRRRGDDAATATSSAAALASTSDAIASFRSFCLRHGAAAVAVGDGVGSRSAERLVASALEGTGVGWRVVSEAGASAYSASPLAAAELPTLDVTVRGAVTLARRLLDPAAELVKVDPRCLGVGLYQHDVGQCAALTRELDRAAESAVALRGADVNTASAALLARVPGVGAALARRIVDARGEANRRDGWASREDVRRDVRGFGPKAFEQAAGFLRVGGARDALERTPVHPESYDVARRIVAAFDDENENPSDSDSDSSSSEEEEDEVVFVKEVSSGSKTPPKAAAPRISRAPKKAAASRAPRKAACPTTTSAASLARARVRLRAEAEAFAANGEEGGPNAKLDALAAELGVPAARARDVARLLAEEDAWAEEEGDDEAGGEGGGVARRRAGWGALRTSARDAAALRIGDVVEGTVRNVVPFGAFVDVGVAFAGLVHATKMGRGRAGGVKAGDAVKVRVERVDLERERIALALCGDEEEAR